ncbi:hypothetical protein HK405_003374, partial [Cladochytrium tenue]
RLVNLERSLKLEIVDRDRIIEDLRDRLQEAQGAAVRTNTGLATGTDGEEATAVGITMAEGDEVDYDAGLALRYANDRIAALECEHVLQEDNIQELLEENAALRAPLEASDSAAATAALEARLAAATERLAVAEANASEAQAAKANVERTAREEITKAEEYVKTLHARIATLDTEIERTRADAAAAAADAVAARDECRRAEMDASKARDEANALRKQVSTMVTPNVPAQVSHVASVSEYIPTPVTLAIFSKPGAQSASVPKSTRAAVRELARRSLRLEAEVESLRFAAAEAASSAAGTVVQSDSERSSGCSKCAELRVTLEANAEAMSDLRGRLAAAENAAVELRSALSLSSERAAAASSTPAVPSTPSDSEELQAEIVWLLRCRDEAEDRCTRADDLLTSLAVDAENAVPASAVSGFAAANLDDASQAHADLESLRNSSVASQQGELDALRARVVALSNVEKRVAELEEELRSYQASCDKTNSAKADAERIAEATQEELALTRASIVKLEASLCLSDEKFLAAGRESGAAISDLKSKLEAVCAELELAEKRHRELDESVTAAREELQTANETIEEKDRLLKLAATDLEVGSAKPVADGSSGLEARITALSIELSSEREMSARVSAESVAVQAAFEKAVAEIAGIRESLAAAESACSDAQSRAVEAEDELERTRLELSSTAATVASREEEKAQLVGRIEALELELSSITKCRVELEAKCKELKCSLDLASQTEARLGDSLKDAEQDLRSQESESRNKLERLQEVVEQLTSERDYARQDASSRSDSLAATEAELQALRAQQDGAARLAALDETSRAEARDTEMADLRRDLAEAQAQCARRAELVRAAEDRLEAAREATDAARRDIDAQRARVCDLEWELERASADADAARQDAVRLKTELFTARCELNGVAAARDAAEVAVDTARVAVSDATAAVERLQADASAAREEFEAALAQRDDAAADIRAESEELAAKLRAATSDAEHHAAAAEQALTERDELSSKYDEAQATAARLAAEVAEARHALETAGRAEAEAKAATAELKDRLEEKSRELEQSRARVGELEELSAQLTAAASESKMRVSDLTSEIEALRNQLEKLRNRVDELDAASMETARVARSCLGDLLRLDSQECADDLDVDAVLAELRRWGREKHTAFEAASHEAQSARETAISRQGQLADELAQTADASRTALGAAENRCEELETARDNTIDEVRRLVDELRREANDASAVAEHSTLRADELERRVAQLLSQVDASAVQVAGFQTTLKERDAAAQLADSENATLRDQCSELAEKLAAAAEVETGLLARLKSSEDRLAGLEEALERRKAAHDELRREADELRAAGAAAASHADGLTAEAEARADELASLRAERSVTAVELEKARSSFLALEDEKLALLEDADRLTADLAQARAAADAAGLAGNAATADLERARAALAEKAAIIKQFESAVVIAQREIENSRDELDRARTEVAERAAAGGALAERVAELEAALADSKPVVATEHAEMQTDFDFVSGIADLEATVGRKSAETDGLRGEVASLSSQREDLRAELAAKVGDADACMVQLREEKSAIELALARAGEQLDEAARRLQGSDAQLQAAQAGHSEDVDRLRSELASLEVRLNQESQGHASAITDLQELLATSRTELEAARNEVLALKGSLTETEAAHAAQESARSATFIEELKSSLAAASDELLASKDAVRTGREAREALEAELDESRAEVANLSGRLTAIDRSLADVTALSQSQEAKLGLLLAELASAQEELEARTRDVTAAELRAEESLQENETLLERSLALTKENRKLTALKSKLERSVEKLTAEKSRTINTAATQAEATYEFAPPRADSEPTPAAARLKRPPPADAAHPPPAKKSPGYATLGGDVIVLPDRRRTLAAPLVTSSASAAATATTSPPAGQLRPPPSADPSLNAARLATASPSFRRQQQLQHAMATSPPAAVRAAKAKAAAGHPPAASRSPEHAPAPAPAPAEQPRSRSRRATLAASALRGGGADRGASDRAECAQ